MSVPFSAGSGPIEVDGSLSGPLGQAKLRLVLNTGATASLIRPRILAAVGYDPDASPHRVPVDTGFGIHFLPRIVLNRFSALDHHRLGWPVLAHDLSPESGIDGLLGLDFLRGSVLTLDFRAGQIDLT